MSDTPREDILKALEPVIHPDLEQTLGEMRMIKDVSQSNGTVSVDVEFITPSLAGDHNRATTFQTSMVRARNLACRC